MTELSSRLGGAFYANSLNFKAIAYPGLGKQMQWLGRSLFQLLWQLVHVNSQILGIFPIGRFPCFSEYLLISHDFTVLLEQYR